MRLHTSDLKPNPDEVGEVFTVPLQYLLNMEPTVGHLDISTRPLKDFPFYLLEGYNIDWKIRQNYSVYFYPYEQYTIWVAMVITLVFRYLQVNLNKKDSSQSKDNKDV